MKNCRFERIHTKGLLPFGGRQVFWVSLLIVFCAVPLLPASPPQDEGLPDGLVLPLRFREIWGYVLDGREADLAKARPVSDVGYFGAGVNAFGQLTGVPDRNKLRGYAARAHLVVALLSNQSLTHFTLHPRYGVRDRLLAEIVAASVPYDGVQLDYESIHRDDMDAFIDFLIALREAIPQKVLSIALPARVSASHDWFGYARIAGIVDRIIVMAYDEHWSGSGPGPIASMDWGERVARYATSQIPAEKLVMGAPFYGRSWASENPAKAHIHSTIERIRAEAGVGEVQRKDGIPWFTRDVTVRVTTWYEDAQSNTLRLFRYQSAGVRNIAFWRVGQEDPEIWTKLEAGE